jgi:large subunit ribosomal protein L29
MKAQEIREWENSEIEARMGELKQELFRLKFKTATMQLENPRLINNIRKDIARLNTILRERELAKRQS